MLLSTIKNSFIHFSGTVNHLVYGEKPFINFSTDKSLLIPCRLAHFYKQDDVKLYSEGDEVSILI